MAAKALLLEAGFTHSSYKEENSTIHIFDDSQIIFFITDDNQFCFIANLPMSDDDLQDYLVRIEDYLEHKDEENCK